MAGGKKKELGLNQIGAKFRVIKWGWVEDGSDGYQQADWGLIRLSTDCVHIIAEYNLCMFYMDYRVQLGQGLMLSSS